MPAFDPSCIDVADFLECLEIRNVVKATEHEFRFSCPYPAHSTGDQTPSGYMNIDTTAFFCQSCHAKGNAISFAQDVLNVSPLQAIRMLKGRYGKQGIDPDSRSMVEEIRKILNKPKETKRQNKFYDESVLARYAVDWIQAIYDELPWALYMHRERGFSPAYLERWQFGYSQDKNRITLPIRDELANLVGIKARVWDDRKPKYLNLHDGEIESYLKNDVVFALNVALAYEEHDLIIVEGEFNAIRMHSYGYCNTVAINGSYFGERQIQLLKQYADSATLFFDSDSAGRDATNAVSDALRPFMPVFICPDHYGDPCEMNRASVDACIADRVSLLRRRILLRS